MRLQLRGASKRILGTDGMRSLQYKKKSRSSLG